LVVYEVKSGPARLEDYERIPKVNAKIVIREASAAAKGPETVGGARKGRVVIRLKTGMRGEFIFPRLAPGRYWLTFVHPQDGESFYLEVTEGEGSEAMVFRVGNFGGRCYLVDIERNVTKPPGWPLPVKQRKSN
jgi:hypothetical protein